MVFKCNSLDRNRVRALLSIQIEWFVFTRSESSERRVICTTFTPFINLMTSRLSTFSLFILFAACVFTSCKDDEAKVKETRNTVPEFFKPALEDVYGQVSPEFTLIANEDDYLLEPQDLDFNPIRPFELWVINKGIIGKGGHTVTFSNAGTDNQQNDSRQDVGAWWYMAIPTAISFSENGNWVTTPGIQDANNSGGILTGPTLWTSDMDIYGKPQATTYGTHIDAQPYCPLSMGATWDSANAFWLFDGYHKHLVRVDFAIPHNPGEGDHDNGRIFRYPEVELIRGSSLPCHLALDAERTWLYVVDGINRRILKVDSKSGRKAKELDRYIGEPLVEHAEMGGVVFEEIVASSDLLKRPCGIEIVENRLFITDYENGNILCFDAVTGRHLATVSTGEAGIMGIRLGPDKKLWYVNSITNEVRRLDPR